MMATIALGLSFVLAQEPEIETHPSSSSVREVKMNLITPNDLLDPATGKLKPWVRDCIMERGYFPPGGVIGIGALGWFCAIFVGYGVGYRAGSQSRPKKRSDE